MPNRSIFLSGETLTELYIDTVNFFIAIVNYTSRSSLRCQEKGNTIYSVYKYNILFTCL